MGDTVPLIELEPEGDCVADIECVSEEVPELLPDGEGLDELDVEIVTEIV